MNKKPTAAELVEKLNDSQDFEQLRSSLMTELQGRNRLKEIPEEVKAKTQEYIEVGGDSEALATAITEGVSEREANLEAQKEKLEAFEVDNPPFELEEGGEPELV